MTDIKLQLSGQSESLPAFLRAQLGDQAYQEVEPALRKFYGEVGFNALEPHRDFFGRDFFGQLHRPIAQMPLLVSGKDEKGKVVDVPRDPASFAYVLERRMEAPQDVKVAWRDSIFTGDGSIAGTEGDHLIVFDAQALREMTPESELYEGALVLPAGAWQELKSEIEKDDSKGAYLNAEEVRQAHGQGYERKNRVLTPVNRSVAKVWDALSKGRDLTSYVRLVNEDSPHTWTLLTVYFNKSTKDGKPTMRSWVAGTTYGTSLAEGIDRLDYDYGRLVGLAPEAYVAREKAWEARVQSALESRKPFEVEDLDSNSLCDDSSPIGDRSFVGVHARDTVRTENNLLERVCSKLSQLYRR